MLLDSDTIEVEINTASINTHHCLVEGRGGINARGDLVVQTDHPLVLYGVEEPIEGPRCWIRFDYERGQLTIAEVWPSECGANPAWCGGRGEMIGHTFRVADRQPGRCTSYDSFRDR